MLFQIVIENGVKKIKPLTADAGAGNPVGTLIHTYKKSNPSGYLYCDGSTFDATAYPLLYAYLGSNVLPDYRECAMVGAEQNTTDTIATHDVYTEGQFKDDQVQDHIHEMNPNLLNFASNSYQGQTLGVAAVSNNSSIYADTIIQGRHGDVTRGKRKAVYIYIKATSGLSENAQDNVINTLNEQGSYSTTEHLTGKKWIDGKPIYSKTVDCGALPNAQGTAIAHNIANIDKIIHISGVSMDANGITLPLPYVDTNQLTYGVNVHADKTNISIETGYDRTNYINTYITVEYTKTTD